MTVALQTGNIVSGTATPAPGTPSYTDVSVTVSAGSDLCLFLLLGYGSSSWDAQFVAPTFNGVALTLIGGSTGGANSSTRCYYLVNPSVGTFSLRLQNNVYTGAAFPYAAIPCSGVHQSTPHGTAVAYTTGSSSSPRSSSVTVAAGGVAIAGHGVYAPSAAGLAVGAGQTAIGSVLTASSREYAFSYLADATAMGYSWTSGATQNQQYVVPIAPAPVSLLSGEAVLAGITADGSMAPQPDSSLSGDAVLAGITAEGGMGLAPGVITTPVLKNNTGTILASVSGIVANIYHPTTGALVVRKTGLSSDGSGVVIISDVLLVPGTTYAYELDLSATSQGRRLPTGVAA